MLRQKLIFLVILCVILLLPGCAPPVDEAELIDGQIPVSTEFGRMLGFVPYSFLEEHDIWFCNPGEVRNIYGFEDITSIEAFNRMSEEDQQNWKKAMNGIGSSFLNKDF